MQWQELILGQYEPCQHPTYHVVTLGLAPLMHCLQYRLVCRMLPLQGIFCTLWSGGPRGLEMSWFSVVTAHCPDISIFTKLPDVSAGPVIC